MAVKLRLRREGTVKRPSYRIVAADSRSPRDGRFIEIIGEYRPLENPSLIRVDNERALHWLRHGAQPTSAVEKLLRIVGVWAEFKPSDEAPRKRSADKKKVSKKERARRLVAAEAAAAPAPKPVVEAAPVVAEAPVVEDAPVVEEVAVVEEAVVEPAAEDAPVVDAPVEDVAPEPVAEAAPVEDVAPEPVAEETAADDDTDTEEKTV